MDKYKGMNGRRFRTEGLIETPVPVAYNAAAMPGALVLGADRRLYVSVGPDQTGAYYWQKTLTQSSDGSVAINVDSFDGGFLGLVVGGFGGASELLPGRIAIVPGIEPQLPGTGTGQFGSSSSKVIGRLEFMSRDQLTTASNIGRPARIAVFAAYPGWTSTSKPCDMAFQVASQGITDIPPVRLQILSTGHTQVNGASGERIATITSEGNVLIGNTTGTQRLCVTGNIQVSGGGVLVGLTAPRNDFFYRNDTPTTGYTPAIQIEGLTTSTASLSITGISGEPSGGRISLGRAEGDQTTRTIVQNATQLGTYQFLAYDGEKMIPCSSISSSVAGTPGIGVVPADLKLRTSSAVSAGLQTRVNITAEGVVTVLERLLINNSTGTERLCVTGNIQVSGGGTLVGLTAPRSDFNLVASTPTVSATPVNQLEGTTAETAVYSINAIGSTVARSLMSRANGTQTARQALVNGDQIGVFQFGGFDGTRTISGAQLTADVDGTVATDDMPLQLRLRTRAAGVVGTETRLTIRSSGTVTIAGNLQINNSTGTERLCVTGNAQLTDSANYYMVGTNPVVGSRKTGWAAPTGTATKSTFATSTVTTAQLAERVKALIDDLTTHGLIGA